MNLINVDARHLRVGMACRISDAIPRWVRKALTRVPVVFVIAAALTYAYVHCNHIFPVGRL